MRNLLVAFLLVASAAYGAVTITYNTGSTKDFSLKTPPVRWVGGPDSSGNPFVSGFALSSNQTYYTVTMRPVPEANVTWGNFTTLENTDTNDYTVTVAGDSLSGYPKVLVFQAEFYAYGTDALLGTIDLKAASPSANLGTLTAGSKAYTKVFMKLDDGTGASDLPANVGVSLTLSPA